MADDLAAGRLVRPRSESVKTRRAYHLIHRQGDSVPDKVHAFCAWIQDEAQQSIQADIITAWQVTQQERAPPA